MKYSFDWDQDKALTNRKKHKVSFDEASTVFDDSLAQIWYDESHSDTEHRHLMIGHSLRERLLVVSYTVRDHNVIRIISTRLATRKECARYEESKDFGSRNG